MKNIFTIIFILFAVSLSAEIIIDESFDSATLPTGWTQDHEAGNVSWMASNGGHNGNPAAAHSGARNAYIFAETCTTKLVTPMLNIGGSNSATLSFWHAHVEWSGYQDILRIYYKTEPDDDWNLIDTYDYNQTTWEQETVTLMGESSSYFIAFEAECGWGHGVVLDDVVINGDPSPVGVVEGHVYDSSGIPLTGAEVLIEDINMSAITVNGGFYQILAVPQGNHPFFASLDGYGFDLTNATVNSGETTVVDFNLQQYVEIMFSGTVLSSEDGSPIQGAEVTLEGFVDYETLTASNGQFIIPGVYSDNTYELIITKPTFNPHSEMIEIAQVNYNTGEINLIAPIDITGWVNSTSDPETGLAGAEVELSGYEIHSVQTTADGQFLITDVFANEDYTILITYDNHNSYQEYLQIIESNIDLETITLIGPVMVSGYIYGSDNSVLGIPDAEVSLSGFANHSTTTDSTGFYAFTEVFANVEYLISVETENYQQYETEIDLESIDMVLDDIFLLELTEPAGNVIADIVEENSTQITWNQPGSGNFEFRYDDGNPQNAIGLNATRAILGAVHPYSAVIKDVSWYLTDAHTHTSVKIYIFGVSNNGEPDSNDILYQSGNVSNSNNQWCSYTLPSPITAPEGFFVGISTPNHWTDVAMDNGDDEPYVFQSGTQFAVEDYQTGDWMDIDGFPNVGNLLIRASGINLGPALDRVFEGYQLFRLPDDEMSDPEEWEMIATNLQDTTFTDENWWHLDEGDWTYAVRCQHTNGVYSMASFSNILEKDDPPEFAVDLNISNSNGDPIHYAVCELSSFWNTYNSISNVTGLADYNAVNPGIYNLHIEHSDYADYDMTEVVIEDYFTMDITLQLTDNDENQLTSATRLIGNFPNPFNPQTDINFMLADEEFVNISIYNTRGQLVENCLNSLLPAGEYNIVWDAKDQPSGIYFVNFKTDSMHQIKKAVLLK